MFILMELNIYLNKTNMTDKQTTWEIHFRNKFNIHNLTEEDCPSYQIEYFEALKFFKSVIQEEREKVIAEFISGERCSDCGKLITDGSSGCCKDCWENN